MPDIKQNRNQILALAKILWEYNNISQSPINADLLLVMGTSDEGVARFAAELEQKYTYNYVVVSGGVTHKETLHGKAYAATEANFMASIMVQNGVARSKIILEEHAHNTGENITFTAALLNGKDASISTGQLVHAPGMQRRALATAKKQWSEVAWNVSGQEIEFEKYIYGLDVEKYVNRLVGNTFSILLYPNLGFQIPQEMPAGVREAMDELIKAGFGKNVPENYKADMVA